MRRKLKGTHHRGVAAAVNRAATAVSNWDDDRGDVPEDKPRGKGDMQESRYVAWYLNQGTYRAAGPTVPNLPAGIYNVKIDSDGWYLEPTTFNSDELLHLPGLPIDFILKQIDTFWSRQEQFAACGLLHKRGILMYGAAGCGKTSIIKLLSNNIVDVRDGVVLLAESPEFVGVALQALRQVEPTRPVLTIMEDIDAHMEDEYSKRTLLSLLDGEKQVNHIVHLATTNYPDLLAETIMKRPGRFDVVIELKHPVREAREMYLRSLLGAQVTEEQLLKLVDATAGLGLAHLRELVSATHCLGLDLEETLARLKGNMRVKFKSPKVGDDDEKGVGFSIGFGNDA